MEKEINIEKKGFCLNFYYEEFDFTDIEIMSYRDSLNRMIEAFTLFKNDSLKLSKFTLHLNLSICSNDKIQQLNNDHRDKNKITDVLSFPLQENIRKGEFDKFIPELEIGDIYISSDVCHKQALEFGLSFQEEFMHLATHGFLHLCGYDHEISDEEEKLMENLEEKIIVSMKK